MDTKTKRTIFRITELIIVISLSWTFGYMTGQSNNGMMQLREGYIEISDQLDDANARLDMRESLGRSRSLTSIEAYIRRANPKVYGRLAAHISEAIHNAADRNKVPVELLAAIMRTESNFDPFAVSGANARGLMQVRLFDGKGKPVWYHELKAESILPDHTDIYDPTTNAMSGGYIFAAYMESERSISKALGRYSGNATDYMEKVARNLGAIRLHQIETEMKRVAIK